MHGLSCVQPGRWERTPLFDKNGNPVEYTTASTVGHPPESDGLKKRNELIVAVSCSDPVISVIAVGEGTFAGGKTPPRVGTICE